MVVGYQSGEVMEKHLSERLTVVHLNGEHIRPWHIIAHKVGAIGGPNIGLSDEEMEQFVEFYKTQRAAPLKGAAIARPMRVAY